MDRSVLTVFSITNNVIPILMTRELSMVCCASSPDVLLGLTLWDVYYAQTLSSAKRFAVQALVGASNDPFISVVLFIFLMLIFIPFVTIPTEFQLELHSLHNIKLFCQLWAQGQSVKGLPVSTAMSFTSFSRVLSLPPPVPAGQSPVRLDSNSVIEETIHINPLYWWL